MWEYLYLSHKGKDTVCSSTYHHARLFLQMYAAIVPAIHHHSLSHLSTGRLWVTPATVIQGHTLSLRALSTGTVRYTLSIATDTHTVILRYTGTDTSSLLLLRLEMDPRNPCICPASWPRQVAFNQPASSIIALNTSRYSKCLHTKTNTHIKQIIHTVT